MPVMHYMCQDIIDYLMPIITRIVQKKEIAEEI